MVVGDVSAAVDVVVIGGGPAGYTAAIRAAQHDLEVALVEREHLGGTCLNFGCIPSKALISATEVASRAAGAERMGIHADPTVDVEEMVGWKDRVVRRLTGGVEQLCEANGVELLEGTATFLDDERLQIGHADDGRGGEPLAYEHAVIATGSRPIELPALPFDADGIMDSREVLALSARPDSLVVVGAGYIGMELAGVFARLGTDVTVVEMLDRALTRYPAQLVEPVIDRAEKRGIDFLFGHRVEGYNREGETVSVVATDADGEEADVDGDRVLVAVGREPVTETVGLDALDLEVGEDGAIATDERRETPVDGVYAVGDVAGDPMLAHVGMAEGVVSADAIAGAPAAFDHLAIPEVVFTDPEIATVGMNADEAQDAGYDARVGEFPFRASGRAMTVEETDGFVRLVADEATDRLLGGAVVGHEASELIGEIGLGVELGATLEDIARTIHTHPTLSEAIMEAAAHGHGEAIHRQN